MCMCVHVSDSMRCVYRFSLNVRLCSIERLEHTGLTPKTWLGAPADVMEETLSFISQRYGSIEGYLAKAGTLVCA
jgi:hypothetical protein